MQEEAVDLRRYLDILVRWWWLLVLGPLIAGAGAYFYSSQQTPTYQAATLVLVQQTRGSPGITLEDINLSAALVSTYREVITTRPVLEAVIEEMGLGQSADSLRDRVTVTTVPTTLLLRIAVTDQDPQQAARVSNSLAEQFIRLIQDNQLAEIARIQSAAAAQGLSDPQQVIAAQLAALSSLTVWERAVDPLSPIAPRVALNTLLAVLLGSFLAIGATVLLEYLNDTPRAPEDIERRTGLSGIAPGLRRVSTVLKWDKREVTPWEVVAVTHPQSSYAEAFRQARLNLQFLSRSPGPKRYMVTSAGPGVGKTTFAVNLAASLAQGGKRVTLVDADLRRPAVHLYFSLDNQTGLTTFLATPGLDVAQVARPTGIEGLRVVTSGPIPPNPAELLGAEEMGALLERLGQEGDVVILDTPPLLAVTDSIALAAKGVETILMVDPKTRIRALRECQEVLSKTTSPVLGFVLNRFSARRVGYGYSYYTHYSRYYGGNHQGERSTASANGQGRRTGGLRGLLRGQGRGRG